MKYAAALRVCTFIALAILTGCQAATPPQPSSVYDIRSFGATGDGKTLDSPAINRAIDAATAAGGGTVFFPAGTYRSVSIHLKSNITLHLDQGATLLAATINDTDRYDDAEPNEWDRYQDFGHSHFHNSLIWGENIENVAIEGPGRIWGEGLSHGVGPIPGLPYPVPSTRPARTEAAATMPTSEPATRPAGTGRGRGGTARGGTGRGGAARGRGPTSRPQQLPETFQEFGYAATQPSDDNGEPNLPPHTGRLAMRAAATARAATRASTRPATRPANTNPDGSNNPIYPNAANTLPQGVGNKSIALKNVRNVVLRDFSILHGGHFGILATGVDNLTIDNLNIDTNRDGMDIDSCRNVHVSNCSVNSPTDDAICLKSDYALGYLRPCENITITNCFVTGGYVEGTLLDATYVRSGPESRVSRTGRIKMGTESAGGFKNVAISNCVFDNCSGLALECVDGGVLEDIAISNITMRDIVDMPIFIRLGTRNRAPNAPDAVVRHITIDNLICTNTSGDFASVISGIPEHPIEDVKISNVRIISQGGGDLYDAAARPAELARNYPEPDMFGVTPTFGFYIRHVDGIEMNNVQVSTEKPESRAPFMLIDVQHADFDHVKTPLLLGTPTFLLDQVDDFQTHACPGIKDMLVDHADRKGF